MKIQINKGVLEAVCDAERFSTSGTFRCKAKMRLVFGEVFQCDECKTVDTLRSVGGEVAAPTPVVLAGGSGAFVPGGIAVNGPG